MTQETLNNNNKEYIILLFSYTVVIGLPFNSHSFTGLENFDRIHDDLYEARAAVSGIQIQKFNSYTVEYIAYHRLSSSSSVSTQIYSWVMRETFKPI